MSESPTQWDFEEHFKDCSRSPYDQHDFAGWIDQHDAEVAKAERERIVRVLAEQRNAKFERWLAGYMENIFGKAENEDD
jgi:hypothetical protein